MDKPNGFAALTPEQRNEMSRKGGSVKGKKGFATMTVEERKINARKGALASAAVRKRKDKNGKDSIPSGDRSTDS